MTKVLDQMLMDMELKNFSAKTIQSYLFHAQQFCELFKKSPTELGEQEIRGYLHYLKKQKNASVSQLNIAYCALRFLYVLTLKREWDIKAIPHAKAEKRLPRVLSRAEVKQLLDAVVNPKHRLMLMTTYSAGLRVSETAHLKLSDIDSERMMIRVDQGKGNKDRYSLLSLKLLDELRRYWKLYRPRFWLFPSRDQQQPINISSIQRAFIKAKQRAGIHKPASVHTLRHSFATHLLEQGVDVFTLQKLLGHSSVKTTSIYIHIQRKNLIKIINPLDQLLEDK